MEIDGETKAISDQWLLTSEQRIELIDLLETDEKGFFEISEEIGGLINDYLSLSAELPISLISPSSSQRHAIETTIRRGSEFLESLNNLTDDQMEYLTKPSRPTFREDLVNLVYDAGKLFEYFEEIPIPRGSKSLVFRDILIKDLVWLFASVDANVPSEENEIDHYYIDRVEKFVYEILGWAKIPCSNIKNTKSSGEESQSRLRRDIKELLRSEYFSKQ